ncbi:MAG: hypothetical protein ACXWJJ_03540, partial [Ramlibacter sp.]
MRLLHGIAGIGISALAACALHAQPRATAVARAGDAVVFDGRIDAASVAQALELLKDPAVMRLVSCANYVLPAARRKLLGRPGAVAWHGNMAHVLHLVQTGQGTWSGPEVDDARRLARREAALYASLGVDGFVCWFAKLPPYAVDEFYTLAPAD